MTSNGGMMATTVSNEAITEQFVSFLQETFEKVQGIYLDKGTSVFETLEGLTAKQASRPTHDGGSSIAGHIGHIRFYVSILRDYMNGIKHKGLDWNQSWQIRAMSESEWDILRGQLRDDYDALVVQVKGISDWNDDDRFGGAMAIIVHTAYHLGAIRQMAKVAG
ncbi:MAG: DinB family protein [Candidatus Zixiibacteriota bacterium]